MKVRMKKMESRREIPDGDNDGSSSENGSSDKKSHTSDDESSKDTTDDASSILPAPSGLKRPNHPRELLNNRNHQSNQEDFQELTQ